MLEFVNLTTLFKGLPCLALSNPVAFSIGLTPIYNDTGFSVFVNVGDLLLSSCYSSFRGNELHVVDQRCLRGVVGRHNDLDLETVEGRNILNREGESSPVTRLHDEGVNFIGGTNLNLIGVVRETGSVEGDPVDLGQFTVITKGLGR